MAVVNKVGGCDTELVAEQTAKQLAEGHIVAHSFLKPFHQCATCPGRVGSS